MSTCSFCRKQELMPYTCKFCGELFCGDHRLPENHECSGLKRFKETRGREIEKWVYEPFKDEYKEKVGRPVRRPISKRALDALKDIKYIRPIDTRMILYLILLFIFIILIWEGLK